ncbi:MAG: alanine/ornithine racemase family PLP-dependent enzyme [Weeksellaceae bacterium]|jgi:predicted amino acid racemase|nr:alanine/ornithine racemase family PLP-dependent enzyme [Weeksellaceae bacterium]
MAHIELNKKKLRGNYQYLNRLFTDNDIKWGVVSKVFCGSKTYLKEIINLGVKQMCDSRITNLKIIKSINPNIETVFIKPPAKRYISSVVKYADASFNTEYETIKMLSAEAVRQNKIHKIIIMIELGELREGVMREEFIDFYGKVFNLPNIEVVALGTNLTCMYGVLPNQDKLLQLCLYEQLIEAKFNKVIPYITGGSSVTIPLISRGLLPKAINHFRVGETLFLGTDVYNNEPNPDMHQDVFKLYAEIIELREKPMIPDGNLGHNVSGEVLQFNEDENNSSHRAIIDIGLLDVEEKHIQPLDADLKIVGSSSDMMVVDLGKNSNKYKVGNLIEFDLDYMAILRLMNCDYVDKKVTEF